MQKGVKDPSAISLPLVLSFFHFLISIIISIIIIYHLGRACTVFATRNE